MNISISTIIPTYNRWPVIRRAVDSVLSQLVQADEIIVVDDGSTDNTTSKLQQHYSDRINVIQQPNQGVSAARNHGIEHANGNWIALLDSDDVWHPDKLQKQKQTIASNDSCVLCHTDEIWIRNGVRVNQMKKHQKSGGDIFKNSLPLCVISPSSALIKRELLNETGLFDTTLPACEDYDLWLRVCAKYKTHYLREPLLTKYGGHEDQLSKKYWGMDRFRIRSLQKLLLNTQLTDEQRQAALNTLEEKTVILLKGAIKHNNQDLSEECYSILKQNRLTIPVAI